MIWRALAHVLVIAGGALAAQAQTIQPADYAELLQELGERVTFERLPRRAEPGFNLDMPLYSRGAWLGERFSGQAAPPDDLRFDRIAGAPAGPTLKIAGGATGQNLSVAWHRGFGSNALFPLGPVGFPAVPARGEGALAILFDHDQAALGFRVHTDYPDPLGHRSAVGGTLDVRFYARNGRLIDTQVYRPGPGITDYGFRHLDGHPAIAGVLIVNDDPGGIAIDDIIFALTDLLG